MKEFLVQIKLGTVMTALLTIALGVLLIMFPAETVTYAVIAVGVVLLLIGGVGAVAGFMAESRSYFLTIVSLIIAFLGLWLITSPEGAASLLPVFIGVLLIVDAINDFSIAAEAKGHNYDSWMRFVLIGVICLILGIICVCHAFQIVTISLMLVGIFLVFDGATDLVMVFTANRAASRFRKEAEAAEIEREKNMNAIDAEFREIETPAENNEEAP
ncbi:MAG: DUF308 domain-containing protein [Eubacterium sp.]|nr:DUF308 domain-containing protein [Eubacterium sp.]